MTKTVSFKLNYCATGRSWHVKSVRD